MDKMDIRSNEQLLAHLQQKQRVKYLCFWGHRKSGPSITKSCLSQWYESSFKRDGETFMTAEHFMMMEKARLFGNSEIADRILASKTPGEAKQLGREVEGFNQKVWQDARFGIVVEGNLLKFSQNKGLKDFLLSTGDRVLVEASPVDKIWGIGLAADHPHAETPSKWQGLNLLGYALMDVRDQLKG